MFILINNKKKHFQFILLKNKSKNSLQINKIILKILQEFILRN